MRHETERYQVGPTVEPLEARALFTTSVNLDLSAVQTVLNGTPQYQPAMSYNGSHGVLVTATPGSTGSLGDAIHATLLDGTGAPIGSPIVVNAATLPLDDHPDVAVAADGSFVVVWTSNTTIYFQQFSSSATAVGTPTSVSASQIADNAAVAYTTNGNFVVTYQAVNGTQGLDVFAQLYHANGSANSAAILVNTTTAGSQQNPRVSSDASGNFVVVWQGATGTSNLDDIYYQQFNSSGARIGSETRVNTTVAGEQADPDVASESDGSFIVAWDSTNAGLTGIYFQQYASSGAANGSETAASTPGTSVQSNPSLAIRDDGIFAAAWVDTTGLTTLTEARYYLPDGSPITSPVTLSHQGQLGTRSAIQFVPSGITVEAYSTSVGSTVTTDVETIAPSLMVQGTNNITNLITATFSSLLLTVEDNGVASLIPTAILQDIDIEGGDEADTITVTGTAASWTGELVIDGNDGDDNIVVGDLPQVTVNGGAGNDTITVGSGSDSVNGGDGDDSITGGAGSDALFGGAGNDTIVSGSGASILDGGDGDDTLIANNLGERLDGDAGNDVLIGGTGNDTLMGGDGNDTITGNGGNDAMNGGAGDDLFILGQGGAATVQGGGGDDTVSYALATTPVLVKLGGFSHNGPVGEDDFIASDVANAIGGSGNDTLVANSGVSDLFGGAGNDLLEAGTGADLLDGNDGNDTLIAGRGTDNLIGASGTDTVSFANIGGNLTLNIDGLPDSGSRGQHDTIGLSIENIIAGSGNDLITGSNANNLIQGGAGNDTILGMAGDDTLLGGSGTDSIDGGSGDDLIRGGTGTDMLNGGTGNDTIYAGSGNDVLHGNTGNDSLIGGSGTDDLFGDAGDDTLITGTGMDLLNGGTGFNKAVTKRGDVVKSIQQLL